MSSDFMYDWIRRNSGRVKVETNQSGSSDNNTHSTYSKEQEYCTKHSIRLNKDNLCSVCMETNNK